MRPGGPALYVRGKRTSLLRAVRTGGAEQLAPRPHLLYVRRACRACPGRATRTAYRVVHHRQLRRGHGGLSLTLNLTLALPLTLTRQLRRGRGGLRLTVT